MVKKNNIVTTDPIADMLTRIRNALNARHEEVVVPASKIKSEIADILVREGFIEKAESVSADGKTVLKLAFKLSGGTQRVIQGLRRISKPGLRVYSKAEDLPKVLGGLGIAIVSTSKGVLTDKEARERKLGGEVLAYIW